MQIKCQHILIFNPTAIPYKVVLEAAGGKPLTCVIDICNEKQVGEAVLKAVEIQR